MRCKRYDTLWWDGGLGAQPHILLDEFDAIERAMDAWREQRSNINSLLNKE